LGGAQSLSRRGGEEKNSQPLPGLKLPIIQPLAQRYTAELSQLLTCTKGTFKKTSFKVHILPTMKYVVFT